MFFGITLDLLTFHSALPSSLCVPEVCSRVRGWPLPIAGHASDEACWDY